MSDAILNAARPGTTAAEPLPPRVQALLEETLLADESAVELQVDPLHAYLHRFTAREPHIAELFADNTRIVPGAHVNTALDEALIDSAREWYHATAYIPADGDIDVQRAERAGACRSTDRVGGLAGALLREVLDDDAAVALLYALDLLLIEPDGVFRVIPRSRMAWLTHRLEPPARAALKTTVLGPHTGVAPALAVVGVPWRYMAFQGPRGYMRMLIDLGRLCERLEAAGLSAGLRIGAALDFVDDVVDRVLDLDGVERTARALITITEEA